MFRIELKQVAKADQLFLPTELHVPRANQLPRARIQRKILLTEQALATIKQRQSAITFMYQLKPELKVIQKQVARHQEKLPLGLHLSVKTRKELPHLADQRLVVQHHRALHQVTVTRAKRHHAAPRLLGVRPHQEVLRHRVAPVLREAQVDLLLLPGHLAEAEVEITLDDKKTT